MENYLGFVEFLFVALFVLCWAILEMVGRRLDRKKEAERAKQQAGKRVAVRIVATSATSALSASGTAASPVPAAS